MVVFSVTEGYKHFAGSAKLCCVPGNPVFPLEVVETGFYWG